MKPAAEDVLQMWPVSRRVGFLALTNSKRTRASKGPTDRRASRERTSHTMKLTTKHAVACIMLVSCLAAPVIAGPYEDASAAYVSGRYAVALRLWQPMADQGLSGAQHGLGLLYDKGRGVTQDFVLAYMWFDLSAAQGNRSAVISRDAAARRMSPTQIAEAQKLVREWQGEGSNE